MKKFILNIRRMCLKKIYLQNLTFETLFGDLSSLLHIFNIWVIIHLQKNYLKSYKSPIINYLHPI